MNMPPGKSVIYEQDKMAGAGEDGTAAVPQMEQFRKLGEVAPQSLAYLLTHLKEGPTSYSSGKVKSLQDLVGVVEKSIQNKMTEANVINIDDLIFANEEAVTNWHDKIYREGKDLELNVFSAAELKQWAQLLFVDGTGSKTSVIERIVKANQEVAPMPAPQNQQLDPKALAASMAEAFAASMPPQKELKLDLETMGKAIGEAFAQRDADPSVNVKDIVAAVVQAQQKVDNDKQSQSTAKAEDIVLDTEKYCL